MKNVIPSPTTWFRNEPAGPTPVWKPVYPKWTGWVRLGPDRRGDLVTGDLYSRKHSAALTHPAVQALSEPQKHHLLGLEIIAYLHITIWLETGIVNDTNAAITNGHILGALPDVARRDLAYIYGDEGGHTAFSLDLVQDIVNRFGFKVPAAAPFNRTAGRLAADLAGLPRKARWLVKFLWTAATETLISANLYSVATDPTVNPVVRAVLADHGNDEKLHALAYHQLFAWAWCELTPEGQKAAATYVVHALDGLLRPDEAWLREALAACGVAEAAAVAYEIAFGEAVSSGIKKAAAPTLGALRHAGALDNPECAAILAPLI